MGDLDRLEYVDKQLKVLPNSPGVYVIFDEKEIPIYVGKASNLSNRVRSHFAKSTDFSKSRVIRERGYKIEVHVTSTENEALLLEYNMIQELQPSLNSQYTDGKTYPYLEVTTGEQWPRFLKTREKNNPNSIYLGPYSDVGSMQRSLRYVLKLFPVADCHKEIHLGDADDWAKTCIRRRTKQCMRPCELEIDHNEYRENVDQVINFMEGKLPDILDDVEKKMREASATEEFEKAAKYRDVMKSINRTMQKQSVFVDDVDNMYVVVQEENKFEIGLSLQKIIDGRIIRREVAVMPKNSEGSFQDFVIQYLIAMLNLNVTNNVKSEDKIKKIILVTDNFKEIKDVLITFDYDVVQKENDAEEQIIKMAKNHIKSHLQRRLLIKKDKELPTKRVEDLREMLGFDLPPLIIDTFDVSTLMGRNNVGSCVRFVNGKPLKKGYRKFKITSVDQQDDFASMYEIVFRRYKDVNDGFDKKGLPIPDLIVIDGGREQLNRGLLALGDNNLKIPIIGLAKREEEIYFSDIEEPMNEDNNRGGMLLLRACRDEAHRFAVTYQRSLRQKEGLVSILDEIDGIGPKRRKLLIRKYKTVNAIAKESSETLSENFGLSKKLSSKVIDACRKFTISN